MLDQSWFAEQISQAILNKSPISIDGSVPIELTDTVDIGSVNGLSIQGASNYVGVQKHRASPCIVWKGPKDKPMFRSRGTGLFFAGCVFHVGDGCSAVFHFEDQPGLADGKSYLEKLAVTTDVAGRHSYDFVRCGNNLGDGHCDTISISDCRTQSARSFLSVRNHQSMGHVIRSPHTFNSLIGLDLQAGGFVVTDGVWTSVQDRVIVQLGQQGRNNGWVKVSGLKVDSQTSALESFKLVQGRPSNCLFIMDGLIPASVSGKWSFSEMVDIGPHVRTKIDLAGLTSGVV